MSKNYKVNYYGHSAFTVETDNHFLIFDYVGELSVPFNGEMIEIKQSSIDFDNINKPITMFHSHTHFDHYNSRLHSKLSTNNNIFTIVGGKNKQYANSTYLLPGDSININGIQIFAEQSTDIGVCFVLIVDGINIYYAGDNIDWGNSSSTSKKYLNSINNISVNICNDIDLAFIPVCNFYGDSYEPLVSSAIYACSQLNAKEVYPMHSQNSIEPYVDFKEYCNSINTNLNIVIPKII